MADHKDLARLFYEDILARGDADRVEEVCTADFVEHEEPPPGSPGGIEGVKDFVRSFHDGFSDLRVSLEDVIEEDDRLVARARLMGTHDGDFMGIPATGKKIDVEVIDIVRIVDGKAAEHWGQSDMMALMQQIGAIPEPAPAA